jgi:hypothetical protein
MEAERDANNFLETIDVCRETVTSKPIPLGKPKPAIFIPKSTMLSTTNSVRSGDSQFEGIPLGKPKPAIFTPKSTVLD